MSTVTAAGSSASDSQPDNAVATSQPMATAGQKHTHEEEPVTASGRAKQQKQDIILIEARHVSRTIDAFLNPGAMFNYGMMAAVGEPDSETEDPSPEQKRYLEVYKYLCRRIPHFQERIIDVDASTFCEHEKLFKSGLSAARSDDIASLKGLVIDWLCGPPYHASTSTHPLARNSKHTHGYNNPVIGELLCPTDLKWEDEAVQQGLRDGTIDVHPSQWPNFLYKDGAPPAEGADMWGGLFRHPLLVKTLKHIYTSPSLVDGADGSQATRASKAALAGMTGITIGALADGAVKLRHSLSSNSTFQKNDKTNHNELFYYGLLEILEAEQSRDQVRELLRWYDRQIFPGVEATSKPASNSALARMRTQLGLGTTPNRLG